VRLQKTVHAEHTQKRALYVERRHRKDTNLLVAGDRQATINNVEHALGSALVALRVVHHT